MKRTYVISASRTLVKLTPAFNGEFPASLKVRNLIRKKNFSSALSNLGQKWYFTLRFSFDITMWCCNLHHTSFKSVTSLMLVNVVFCIVLTSTTILFLLWRHYWHARCLLLCLFVWSSAMFSYLQLLFFVTSLLAVHVVFSFKIC
jgi:hypothetical protein